MDSESERTPQKRVRHGPIQVGKLYGTWIPNGKRRAVTGEVARYEAECVLCRKVMLKTTRELRGETCCNDCIQRAFVYLKGIGKPCRPRDATEFISHFAKTVVTYESDPSSVEKEVEAILHNIRFVLRTENG